MADIAARYDRLSAAFVTTVAGVPDDSWDAPTPCRDWTVLDLVDHMVANHRQFLGFVDRELDPAPPTEHDAVAALSIARDQVLADLRDPARADETYDGVFGERTFAWAVDSFLSFDLAVHRWDLARATGQDDAIPPDQLDRLLADAQSWGDMARAPGVFGPPVEVSSDADPQTRLLAYLGRRA
jgi:uncharacterized protein (TIGR03086 family)